MAASVVTDEGHETTDTNRDAPLDPFDGRHARTGAGRRKRGGT